VAVGLLTVVVAACSNPGAPVAEKIKAANSPIVREVRYSPATFGASVSQDSLIVVLVDGATDAQAIDLWCTVILPAGGDQLPSGVLQVNQGENLIVLPYPTTLAGEPSYAGPPCPAAASPTPSP
jgi:hypothetical protein